MFLLDAKDHNFDALNDIVRKSETTALLTIASDNALLLTVQVPNLSR